MPIEKKPTRNKTKKPQYLEVKTDLSGNPDEPVPGVVFGREIYKEMPETPIQEAPESVPGLEYEPHRHAKEPEENFKVIQGRESLAEEVATTGVEMQELDAKYMQQINNPEGKTPREKENFLKHLYGNFITLKYQRPNLRDLYINLAHQVLRKLGESGIQTLGQYAQWVETKAAKGDLDQEARVERIETALEGAQYLSQYYSVSNDQSMAQKADMAAKQIQKRLQ